MRAMCVHTAVMRRNAIVTIKKSIIGIILISELSDRLPPPPPPTSTPAMKNSLVLFRAPSGAASNRFEAALNSGGTTGVASGGDGEIHLLTVGHNEVEHLNARFVDVVFERLRLAVENSEAEKADDGDDEAEERAVHRF